MEDPRALTQPIRELVTSMCCWLVAQTQQTDILPVLVRAVEVTSGSTRGKTQGSSSPGSEAARSGRLEIRTIACSYSRWLAQARVAF